MLYKAFVEREAIDRLEAERAAQLRAVVSNSAYNEADDQGEARRKIIDDINYSFDEALAKITDPYGKQEEIAKEKLMANPLFAAGLRGFDRSKWQLEAGLDPYSCN